MVKKGAFIRVDYTGRVKDTGMVFDTTVEKVAREAGAYDKKLTYTPIPIISGENHVLKGFDNALEKIEIGETKKIIIAPEDGFGQRDPRLIKLIPSKGFKEKNIAPQVGMAIQFEEGIGIIRSVSGGRVLVDFNNPLAGKDLEYEITITEEMKTPEEKLKGLVEFQTGQTKAGVKIKDKEAEVMLEAEKNVPQMAKKKISEQAFKHLGISNVKFVDEFKPEKEKPKEPSDLKKEVKNK